jgi:predicted porin
MMLVRSRLTRSCLTSRFTPLFGSLLGLFALSGITPSAFAQDASSDFKVTGFVSVVGGKVISGDANGVPIASEKCPCYTADWGNAGIYRDNFSLKPESRAGIQLNYKPTADLSLVGQVVVRGTDSTPNIQWAYGGYKFNKNFELQVGRKRIPLYYYSDFQDIGLSYPWVSTPPELYGWEVTNYNGASLRYNNSFGDMNVSASLFGGSETVKDPLYLTLYYPNKSEVSWKSIVGGDLEISQGALTMRGVYMTSTARTKAPTLAIDDTAKLTAYGLAMNLDLDQWFILSEVTQLERKFNDAGYSYKAPAFTFGAGVHLGEWTPFLNYAQYKESSSDESKYAPQSYKRLSLTLKYDIDASSAVKAQVDRHTDITKNFGGNATVFRLSYDRVF